MGSEGPSAETGAWVLPRKRVMWLVGKVWDSKEVLQVSWETGMEVLAAGFGQNHDLLGGHSRHHFLCSPPP